MFGAATLGTLINIGVATTEEPQLTYGASAQSRAILLMQPLQMAFNEARAA